MDSPPILLTFPRPGLRRWERIGLCLLAVVLVAFASLAELRACYQNTRKTDFGVYLRAAWAVRAGADIYAATDNNGFHYTYPPAFAIVMTPFADAPAGVPRNGLLPYPLVVALWTLLNFVLLGRMAHVLARLALPEERRGSRRWWYARMVPFYIASGGLLYSIGFGQVNVLLLAMLVEMLRYSVTNRSYQSGAWLAAAMVLKVFPAYLVLVPLMRRDWRAGVGAAMGLTIGLGVIPVAGLGLHGTEAAYRSFVSRVLLPGALGNDDPGQLRELHHMALNDNQSFLAVIHHNLHPVRATQPASASKETRLAHNLIVAALTLTVLVAVWRQGLNSNLDVMRFQGVLMLLMLHATPMSHMHYYAFGYLLAAALYLKLMAESPGLPGWRSLAPLIAWAFGTALPLLPGASFEDLRFRGLGPACSMLLLGWTLMGMTRRRHAGAVAEPMAQRRAA